MLERLTSFIGGMVLALAIVFGAAYLVMGTWDHDKLKTALNIERILPGQSSSAPPQTTPQ